MTQKMPFPAATYPEERAPERVPGVRLALYEPDIPQNAGSLMRLGACLGVGIDIIEPCGFLLTDRNFRRAGMDYLKSADICRHSSWARFLDDFRTRPGPRRLVLLTTKADMAYCDYGFAAVARSLRNTRFAASGHRVARGLLRAVNLVPPLKRRMLGS